MCTSAPNRPVAWASVLTLVAALTGTARAEETPPAVEPPPPPNPVCVDVVETAAESAQPAATPDAVPASFPPEEPSLSPEDQKIIAQLDMLLLLELLISYEIFDEEAP